MGDHNAFPSIASYGGRAGVATCCPPLGAATPTAAYSKLERLCRYIARPAVVTERLLLTRQGDVRVALKTPYRNGTTHVIFQPLDFLARLAALVPLPRVNLTRFHGVFAPNSRYRAQITPAGRGRRVRVDPDRPEASIHHD